ncbi:MAG: hypothetical protein SNG14_06075 [Rikenellaceae bacterium]
MKLRAIAVAAAAVATLATLATAVAQPTVEDLIDEATEATEATETTESLTPRRQQKAGLANYREYLTQDVDSMMFTTATVNEDASARAALRPFEQQKLSGSTNGYRVGVYFDNSAQARSGALDVMQRCDSLLRDIPATMSYANPYFKVSVGYCTTEEEAVMMLHRVQRYFPKAYLMREAISVEDIVAARALEVGLVAE